MSVSGDMARALNRVAKWRILFAAWQLGPRPDNDPEAQALRDHREATIMLRVELSTLRNLLVEKGLLTAEECQAKAAVEAEALSLEYEARFPGVKVGDDDRLHLDDRADVTMYDWLP